jgi:hypothetical protein
LDCKFLPILGQSQKRRFQLLRAGSYRQFGAARGVLTALFGVASHEWAVPLISQPPVNELQPMILNFGSIF